MNRPIAIIVLDDGETWGGIDGASICFITEEQHESLCDGSSVTDMDPVFELGLADVTGSPFSPTSGDLEDLPGKGGDG